MMKIKSFTYFNKETGLEIERVEFGSINLFIGISGAGKTQILNKLYELVQVAQGSKSVKDIGSIKAEMSFEVKGKTFIWKIETEEIGISREELKMNGAKYFERDNKKIVINGIELPFIPTEFSLLKIYKEYGDIGVLVEALKSIIIPSPNRNIKDACLYLPDEVLNYLYKIYKEDQEKFLELEQQFINIFPHVENIGFRAYEKKELEVCYEIDKRNRLYICEEEGIEIEASEISSGMMKTLVYLTWIRILDKQGIMITDEFENSLGINCMEEMINSMICTDNIQFILTSHHPYIINNISMNYWKVVFRKGDKIYTRTAEELNLGKSKHDGFFQLMNRLQNIT